MCGLLLALLVFGHYTELRTGARQTVGSASTRNSTLILQPLTTALVRSRDANLRLSGRVDPLPSLLNCRIAAQVVQL